jgi:Tfp pilus assembly protein PilN
MRNIEASPWLSNPKLRIIEHKDKDRDKAEDSTFSLDLVQIVPKGEGSEQ